jgi:hypothetical protein
MLSTICVPLSYDSRSVFSLFSMKYMGSCPLNRKILFKWRHLLLSLAAVATEYWPNEEGGRGEARGLSELYSEPSEFDLTKDHKKGLNNLFLKQLPFHDIWTPFRSAECTASVLRKILLVNFVWILKILCITKIFLLRLLHKVYF